MTGRLVFTGFGVRSYQSGFIPIVTEDAEALYQSLDYAGREVFDHQRSLVFIDCRAVAAEALLKAAVRSLTTDDIHLVYFSGHAVTRADGGLDLCFQDSDGKDGLEGRLSSSHLSEVLKSGKNRRCFLILDCCHAGAALAAANLRALSDRGGLSVLAAVPSFARAEFDAAGSQFTNALVEAIHELSNLGKAITLVGLQAQLVKVYQGAPTRPVLNLTQGDGDVELVPLPDWSGIGEGHTFTDKLLSRFARSDLTTREFMWLDLCRAPDPLKIEVLERYLADEAVSSSLPREPSWRVRRAIGQVIRSLSQRTKQRLEVVQRFLKSDSWMDRCIGLAACGGIPAEQRLTLGLRTVLANPARRTDETWLAHLYLAEVSQDFSDLDLAIRSNLACSGWGLIDIWRRYEAAPVGWPQRLRDADPDARSALVLHVELQAHFCRPDFKPQSEAMAGFLRDTDRAKLDRLRKSDLARRLYRAEPRKHVPDTVALRWALYDLYGFWRDDFRIELGGFFSNRTSAELTEELNLASEIPLTELKMALCKWLRRQPPGRTDEVREAMAWALQDNHPWLRREALPLFDPADPRVKAALLLENSPYRLPGVFDLALQAAEARINVDVDESLPAGICTTEADRLALRAALTNES